MKMSVSMLRLFEEKKIVHKFSLHKYTRTLNVFQPFAMNVCKQLNLIDIV